MSKSKRPKRIGYLGPEGTFTHQALDQVAASRGGRGVPYATVPEVIRALESDEVEAGIVPIENSVEGAVTATLDGLAFGRGALRIAAEVLMPIHFDLFAAAGAHRVAIREVWSHPHAFAQCRKYIAKRRLVTRSALSTAEACQQLRDHPRPGAGAIASSKAGALYGLVAVKRRIEDVSDAVTRFVYLESAPKKGVPPPGLPPKGGGKVTGWDKTSLVLTPQHDRPGSLVELLHEFSSRGINLSRIESRPLKTQLGRYCFFIDAWGHIADAVLGAAVRALSQKEVEVKFLGSYPNMSAPTDDVAVVRRPKNMKTPHPASPARGEEGDRPIRSVGIVGLGLIGGSLAKALKAVGGVRVIGYDIDAKSVREARDSGIECVGTLAALAKGSDLIVMASPIETTEDVFRKIAPALRRGQVVTDVGSVKAPIVAAARRILPARVDFIGGHPMAGSERSGFGVSRPDLFGGSPWILTFDDRTNSAAYLRLMALLLRLGVRIVPMTAEDHDDAVSQISHLPHVIAYTLMSQASAPSGRAMRKELAAGSFRDLVRVSGASPRIWTEICRRNQARVRLALGDYVARLIDVQGALRRGDFDRLRAIFEEGHQGYLRLSDDQRARRTVPLHSGQIRGRMVKVLTDVAARGGRIERKIYRR